MPPVTWHDDRSLAFRATADFIGTDPLRHARRSGAGTLQPAIGASRRMDSTTVKALRALEWLCQRETPTGVTEMSTSLGMVKSNAHRVLTTLESMGYAASLQDGRYQATLKMWEVGSSVLDRLDVKQVARPEMEALSKLTGETVHLSLLDGADVVYVDKVESSQPVRAYSRIGGRAPAHAVATGKALLAFVDDLDALLPKKLVEFTPLSIRDRDSLMKELESVRRLGYSINRGEYREGVCGVGAPIRNERGEVVAAIGISGPNGRLSPARLKGFAPQVFESARKVSLSLGYRPAATMRFAGTAGATASPAKAKRAA
jgi:DNA-binding IclR family transcriptional regulator